MFVSVERFLIFVRCIVTKLYLSSNSWKDDDLSLCTILRALSRIRFILLFKLQLRNIETKGEYPNRDSTKTLNCYSSFINVREW